jgi:hypothetical protein
VQRVARLLRWQSGVGHAGIPASCTVQKHVHRVQKIIAESGFLKN